MKKQKRKTPKTTGVALALSFTLLFGACSAAPHSPSRAQSAGASRSASSEPTGKAGSTAGEQAYHKITVEEAKAMMDGGGVTVVDVRTPEEYAEEHLPGAINLPNEALGAELPEELPEQTASLILYCRTGVRSKQASDKLVELGYKAVYDMGGIVDWPYGTES